ncbi:MAG TPA: carboxymuconolactone decarboxylase family protein [Caulobacteraceae bacterium]|nr:carboxymuconolactone decarboxylase family protein [Caulobacteraceae bacterium]
MVWDTIAAGPRGSVRGPLNVWLHSPGLAQRAQELGAFCRYGSGLPPRLSELAILVTGAFWKAGFEWSTHAPIAAAAGIDPACIEAIRTGETPRFAQADEQAVYAFAHELLTRREVSDATYARAVEVLGQSNVVDLTGVLGYYGLISMTIKVFEVPLPEGEAEPFS